jgi:hypothetical protein
MAPAAPLLSRGTEPITLLPVAELHRLIQEHVAARGARRRRRGQRGADVMTGPVRASDIEIDLFFDLLGWGQIGPSTDLPTRRRGISKDSRAIRDFIADVLVPAYDRMTVRQVFYQCASVANLVPKTEAGYKKIERQVLEMRRAGELSWSFIADGTRWQRKPDTWGSSDDYFNNMIRGYRRDLWQSQGVRIEVWLEKDALADVIIDTTARWDVSLMVSRGQSSATFLHGAAMAAQDAWDSHGVSTVIYTLYDHDPGGFLRAQPTIARDLPAFAPDVPITVTALAVTPHQIAAWNLPTRPGKLKDSQAKVWGSRPNVELDAIDPSRLNTVGFRGRETVAAFWAMLLFMIGGASAHLRSFAHSSAKSGRDWPGA